MQSNASFLPYYGYGYEPPIDVAIAQAPSANDMTNFAFPHPLTALQDPIFNFGLLDGPPGSWSTNALPAPVRLAHEDPARSILPRPVLTRHVQRAKRLTVEERLFTLSHDEYVIDFNEVQVTCSGCESPIKLDRRDGAKFYLGLWNRHKRRCKGVKDKMVCYIPLAFWKGRSLMSL